MDEQIIEIIQSNLSLQSTINNLLNSEVFIGLLAFSLLGGFVYYLKYLFGFIGKTFKRNFTVTISAHSRNDEDVYSYLRRWVMDLSERRKVYQLKVREVINKKVVFEWDDGTYYLFYRNRPISITLETHGEDKLQCPPRTIRVTSYFTKSKNFLENIVKEYDEFFDREKKNKIMVAGKGGINFNEKLYPEQIIMNPELKKDIFEDIEWFVNNKEWYLNRGLGYKRGYLLYGPPGTGKTSLAKAIASYFNREIKIITMGDMANERKLFEEMTGKKDKVILFEDIDGMTTPFIGNRKENEEDEEDKIEPTGGGGSLSSILNVLDGIEQPENAIIIMTTNHPNKLDSALIRPGRIDRKVYMGYCEPIMMAYMFRKFFPDSELTNNIENEIPDFDPEVMKITPAELQELFMENAFDAQSAYHSMISWVQ